MQHPATLISLLVAVAALGVAGYALSESRSLRAELEAQAVLMSSEDERGSAHPGASVAERLALVESEVARIDGAIETGPVLVGRDTPLPLPMPDAHDLLDGEAGLPEQLESVIDEAVGKAVDEKARKIMARANKKPSIEMFADILELEDAQQAAIEREVVAAQHDVRDILNTPTADGAVFMDEFIDLVAQGIATPGKDVGWGKWIARVTTETFPGSDETFGARIESAKQRLRGAFKREMNERQYADFEAWQMDPTEIKDVPGSPFTEVGQRILERARELGAVIPEEGD